MKLILEGTVTLGDTYRSNKSVKNGYIHVNDLDIIPIINEYFRNSTIAFSLSCGNYHFHCKGKCLVDLGYKEYPLEPDFFHIDRDDIIRILKKFEHQFVVLLIEME